MKRADFPRAVSFANAFLSKPRSSFQIRFWRRSCINFVWRASTIRSRRNLALISLARVALTHDGISSRSQISFFLLRHTTSSQPGNSHIERRFIREHPVRYSLFLFGFVALTLGLAGGFSGVVWREVSLFMNIRFYIKYGRPLHPLDTLGGHHHWWCRHLLVFRSEKELTADTC